MPLVQTRRPDVQQGLLEGGVEQDDPEGSTVDAKPLVDGQPVPVLGASEWLDVTDAWITNRHRHHARTGTDTSTSSA